MNRIFQQTGRPAPSGTIMDKACSEVGRVKVGEQKEVGVGRAANRHCYPIGSDLLRQRLGNEGSMMTGGECSTWIPMGELAG